MDQLTKTRLQTLISNPKERQVSNKESPFISLYIPKDVIENSQGDQSPLWHQMVSKVESFVSQRYPGRYPGASTRIGGFYKKIWDAVQERKNIGGVAIFDSPWLSGFIPMGGKVRELAIVSDSFHVKPLLSEIQGQNRYYILTIENTTLYLWEGDSSSIEKKAVFVMPQDRRIPDPVYSQEQNMENNSAGKSKKSFQRDEVRNLIRFYKEVGRRLKRQINHFSDTVYLVGEPSYRALFLSVNKAKNLYTHTKLDVDPKKFDQESLYQLVWNIASQDAYRKIRRLAKDYRLYKLSGRSVESLPDIARAALSGTVEALLVTKDLHIRGELDQNNGRLKVASPHDADLNEDIIDDIAEAVIAQGGKVYLLDRSDMPSHLDAWAVLRRDAHTRMR